jgi:CRP/FNR family cyclic AMP-dependent transcriptional regulator
VDERIVRRAPLFEGLEEDHAVALLAMVTEVQLRRGEQLFVEGDLDHRLFIVDSGKIKLGRVASDGRENLLAVIGPGEMFGELSWFDPGPRTSAARAVSPTVLASLDHDDLRTWMSGRPDVAPHLLRALARRLRRTNSVIADLVFTDVSGRVAKTLLDLAGRFGRSTDQGLRVSHDLTQEELAQLVGASRETVNKALADFAARGWLRLEARSVVLFDVDRLRKRSIS